ncbi:programmed cell death 1 ligand 1 isoform 2-T2 [Clarias gariepinus]|uniref:programmed cell death 1 ligand 1 isoform X2 n=1 Tax=Clarias gariepinus TaxID=13013 RepID=UPI00234CEA5B|nr:programmed cell death 1 ligand 1 isoform X2 [Clarias gariepinus]
MKGEIFTLLLVTWPCLQAVFIVESEQDSYDGELHDKIMLGCRFSPVPDVSRISVTWERVKPLPAVNVYRLYQGSESPDFTDEQFKRRVRILKEELKNFRAVIELSQLRLNDSGTYRCVVVQEEGDYKQTTLTVRAPYKAIKKTIRRLSDKKVELTCESRGLPLARVTWSDDKLMESYLTNRSESSYVENSDGVFVVTSRLYVTHDAKNYTCSYWTDGSKASQTATFSIPDEIPEKSKSTSGYVAIAVIVVMCIFLVFAFLLLHRRKKGQASVNTSTDECESPGQNQTVTSDYLLQKKSYSKENINVITSELLNGKSDIRQDVVNQRHPESNKTAETKTDSTLPHALLLGENIYYNMQDELLDLGKNMLEDGKEGPNKAS